MCINILNLRWENWGSEGVSGFSGVTQQEEAEPGWPDSGAHSLNIDVKDHIIFTTNITIGLQSLIYNSEI